MITYDTVFMNGENSELKEIKTRNFWKILWLVFEIYM